MPYTANDIPSGSGPGGALSDKEAAAFYQITERHYVRLRSLGQFPMNFKVGYKNYTGRSAIADDMNNRESRAAKLTRARQPAEAA